MNNITNFMVDKKNGKLNWVLSGKDISVIVQNIDQAILSNESFILVLVGAGNHPDSLQGYNNKGKKEFQVKAPEGFTFSYLANHPSINISVICGANEKVEGFYDWHFSIDEKTGEVTRYCPAR